MMQDMLADMLKKAIPKEVMDLLTPENIKEMGDKVNAFVLDLQKGIEDIKIEQIEQRKLLDEMKGLLNGYADNNRNGK